MCAFRLFLALFLSRYDHSPTENNHDMNAPASEWVTRASLKGHETRHDPDMVWHDDRVLMLMFRGAGTDLVPIPSRDGGRHAVGGPNPISRDVHG